MEYVVEDEIYIDGELFSELSNLVLVFTKNSIFVIRITTYTKMTYRYEHNELQRIC